MGRVLLIAAMLFIPMGCAPNSMNECGEMCRLGVKSFTTSGGSPICVCNQPSDVCVILAPVMKQMQQEPIEEKQ